MPYVNVPNDLSKIKTKIAFNLTKRQLICFGIGAAIGIPTYLLTRGAIGNTGALFVMLGIMLPAFLMAMYEKDGLPFEKVLRNMINTWFLRPGIRPYRTQNIKPTFSAWWTRPICWLLWRRPGRNCPSVPVRKSAWRGRSIWIARYAPPI